MSDEVPASDATKARRLPLIKARAISLRRSTSMREIWERRRAQMHEYLDDDVADSAGSADVDLLDLPDTL